MGTIQYNIYESPSTKNGQKKFHVRLANPATKEFNELKDYLCDSSTVTKSDVSAVVEGIKDYLITHLTAGERVHIKGIGYFSPSIYTPSFDNRKKFKSQDIQLRGVNFESDAEFKKGLKGQTIHYKLGTGSCSKSYTDEALYSVLNTFFESHETMTLKEFQYLAGMTHSTAYRRIKELCSQPQPAIRKIGPRNSTIYVVNEEGGWRLGKTENNSTSDSKVHE
jgi:predicted histone-like DNA-binding protein